MGQTKRLSFTSGKFCSPRRELFSDMFNLQSVDTFSVPIYNSELFD